MKSNYSERKGKALNSHVSRQKKKLTEQHKQHYCCQADCSDVRTLTFPVLGIIVLLLRHTGSIVRVIVPLWQNSSCTSARHLAPLPLISSSVVLGLFREKHVKFFFFWPHFDGVLFQRGSRFFSINLTWITSCHSVIKKIFFKKKSDLIPFSGLSIRDYIWTFGFKKWIYVHSYLLTWLQQQPTEPPDAVTLIKAEDVSGLKIVGNIWDVTTRFNNIHN